MLGSLIFFLPLALASSPDMVSVKFAGGGRFSCSATASADVSFHDIAVLGQDGAKQVYHRIAADKLSLAWAVNSSEAIAAPDFVACARLAGERGFEAFSAGENCTGYSLQMKFCRCSKGETVLFVREDFIEGEDSVVPLADGAYYPNATVNFGQDVASLEMLVTPSIDYFGGGCNPLFGCEVSPPSDNYDILEGTFMGGGFSFESLFIIVVRDIGWVVGVRLFLDVPSLRTASSCGLPFLQTVPAANEITHKYFLEECGQTITMPDTKFLLVQSHKGLGSVYFPNDVDHDCTVTFDCPSCGLFYIFIDLDEVSGCGEYSFTSTSSNDTEGFDICGSSSTDYNGGPPVDQVLTFKGSSTSESEVLGFAFLLYVPEE